MRQRQARRPIDLLGVLRHLEEACPPVCERDRMRTAGRASLTSPDTACTVAALSAGRLENSMQMCELAEAGGERRLSEGRERLDDRHEGQLERPA
jgi:hypothetical protein